MSYLLLSSLQGIIQNAPKISFSINDKMAKYTISSMIADKKRSNYRSTCLVF